MRTPAEGRRPAGLLFIFITLLIDVMGIGLIIPIMPQLVTQFTGDLTHGAGYYGALYTVFTLMQFLFAPMLGSLSDQVGRKPILLLSLFGAAVSYLMLAWAPSLPWLFVARGLAGLAGASFTVGSTYIADISTPETRAQNFGLLGAAFGVGFIIGPALGGVLGNYGVRLPFYVAGGLSLLNALYGLLVVPESHKLENRRAFTLDKTNPFSWISVLRRNPVVFGLVATYILMMFAHNCLQSIWVLYTTFRFHWTPGENGLSLALVGVTSVIVQAGLIRMIVPRLGDRNSILVGFVIAALSFVCYGAATQGWMMYAILIGASLGGIAGPSLQGLVSSQVGPDEQGLLQGALTSLMSLTGIVAPLVANGLFGYFTSAAAPVQVPGAAFFLGAVCMALGGLNTAWQFARHPAPVRGLAQPAVEPA